MKLMMLLVSIVYTVSGCGDGSKKNRAGLSTSSVPAPPNLDHVETLLHNLPSTADQSSINLEVKDLLRELSSKTFHGTPEFGKGSWTFPVDTILAEIDVLQRWQGRFEERLDEETSKDTVSDLLIMLESFRKKIKFLKASHGLNNRNWVYDLYSPFYEISSIPENPSAELIEKVRLNLRANSGFYRAIARDLKRQIEKDEAFYLAQGEAAKFIFSQGSLESQFDQISYWRPDLSTLVDEVLIQLGDFHRELEPLKDRLIEPINVPSFEDFFTSSEVDENQLPNQEPPPRSEILVRNGFRFGPELYQLSLEVNGINLPAEKLQSIGEEGLRSSRAEMDRLRQELAARGLLSGLFEEKYSDEAEYLRFTKDLAETIAAQIAASDFVTLPDEPMAYFYNKDDVLRYGIMAIFPSLLPEFKGQPTIIVPDYALSVQGESGFILKGTAHNVMAHEGRPGHELHFRSLGKQKSLARKKFGTPAALVEGWGLYSETVAAQLLGESDQDLVYRFYHAQFMALRAARAILDVRLNLGTMGRNEAIEFLIREVGTSRGHATSEVDRYLGSPGRDGSYYYGFRKLFEIKELTKNRIGAGFTEKCFNDAFMRVGGTSLANLEAEILLAAECQKPTDLQEASL